MLYIVSFLVFVVFNGVSAQDCEWGVDEQYTLCVHYYRVVIQNPEVIDVYVGNNYLIWDDLSPCSFYEFTVRAIYNLAIEGPIAETNYVAPPEPTGLPTLANVAAGTTHVNITWRLPSYIGNRCPITSLVVDGSPYYSQAFPIEDHPQRPNPTINISPLNPDTMYFLRIYVVNSGGMSNPFLIAVQTI
ncbi:hypothetical protein NQ314_016841 [Rhamnusium bicolor]|uniref:Fibronectin type-III domain-containing protein n=1 Tax=Rhamnusium bicolor TaxID=1586634 RepID=A0AAV8WVJ2_9CUCU|nr:hypothetical protein NQ314_016841 [Rhamnusium bicolor]